jgi:hypothetical protein
MFVAIQKTSAAELEGQGAFLPDTLALLEVVIPEHPLANGDKVRSMIFSDERFVLEGKTWKFVPSSRLIRPTLLLDLTFRSISIPSTTFPTLLAAKQSGARDAIIVVQKNALVSFPDSRPMSWDSTNGRAWTYGSIPTTDAKASVDLQILLVDLQSMKIVRRDEVHGSAAGEIILPHPLYDTAEFTADVATGDIEAQVQPFRLLVGKAYHEAIKAIPLLLKEHANERTE